MPDRLRLVQLRPPLRPVVIQDLSVADVIYPIRSSLAVGAPPMRRQMAEMGGRYGGQQTVDEAYDNATVSVTLAIVGTTQDDAAARASTLAANLAVPPIGRALEWRPDGITQSVYFELRGSASWDNEYDATVFAQTSAVRITIAWPVAPAGLGDFADVFDPFDDDTISAGDWDVESGAGTLTAGTGRLVATSTAVKRLRHVATGYTWRSAQATLSYQAASTTHDVAIGINVQESPDQGLYARYASGTFGIYKRVAGTWTAVGTPVALAAVAGQDYYLRIRREGLYVAANLATRPLSGIIGTASGFETGSASVRAKLTLAEAALLIPGHMGIVWAPGTIGDALMDAHLEPASYHVENATNPLNESFPIDAVPGDIPPAVAIDYEGTSLALPYLQASWWREPRVANLLPVGATPGSFAITATANVNAAATSNGVDARRRFGKESGVVVTTATLTSGNVYWLKKMLSRRRVYMVCGWLAGTAGSGVLGLKGSGTVQGVSTPAVALSYPGWQFVAGLWSPATDTSDAYVTVQNGTAAITTVLYDGLAVVEVPALCELAASATTGATTFTVREWPAESPSFPCFAALVNPSGASEVVMVTDSPTPTTVTVRRGQMHTTPLAPASSGWYLVPLPENSNHLEGFGVTGSPLGYIDAVDNLSVSGYSVVADAAARTGFALQATIAGASAPAAAFSIDTSLLDPDPFSDSIQVEAWARVKIAATMVSPRFVLYAYGTGVGLRYTAEGGSSGIALTVLPAATQWRYVYLGTLNLPAGRVEGRRMVMDFIFTTAGGSTGTFRFDHLTLLPAGGVASTPDGKPADGSYPSWWRGAFGNVQKMIRTRLSTFVAETGHSGRRWWWGGAPDAGIGGAELEPRWNRRGGELLIRPSTRVIGDPVEAAVDDSTAADRFVHAAIQPRYALFRNASE